MKKSLLLWLLLIVVIVVGNHYLRFSIPPQGTLHLPLPSPPLTEAEISRALSEIRMEPPSALTLQTKDRIKFLRYVQQLCAVAELPSKKSVILSKDAQVWSILQVNWPSTRSWFTAPALAAQDSIDLKALIPRILTLVP